MPLFDSIAPEGRLARWLRRGALAAGAKPEPYDPFEAPATGLSWDESTAEPVSEAYESPLGVTGETLYGTRQEVVHSLDRDRDDPFFWCEARPDVAAGLARSFLASRAPNPYWAALIRSNSYALWGALALARARAVRENASCQRRHLSASVAMGLRSQAADLEALPRSSRAFSDLDRAEGLPLPGSYHGDAHRQAVLRTMLAAELDWRSVDWPELPPRLSALDDIPELLPALEIDLGSLAFRERRVSRVEAEDFWFVCWLEDRPMALMVPDWASWMLAGSGPSGFSKIPFP